VYELGVTVLIERCCYSNVFEEKTVRLTADQYKKEICIYHSNNSNKSQQDIANVLLQSLIFKTYVLGQGSTVPLISECKGTDTHWKHLRCTHFAS